MNFPHLFLSHCCLAIASSGLFAEEVDYTRDVRPILSGRCFKCHGPDPETRESGLRLDEEAASREELESGEKAIVPGNIEASELLARVLTTDDSIRMPPPDQGPALSKQEIEILKRWVQSGAKYDKHWSFVSPKLPKFPAVKNADWPRNGIDRFVLKKLEAQGLKPHPPRRSNSSSTTIHQMLMKIWSTDCWHRLLMGSEWRESGWTWPAMPTPQAMQTILHG